MTREPWMKWYPSDWRSEKLLKMVSRASRSFWMDLIGLMHEAEPYGHLIIAGISPSVKQIASVLGDRETDVRKWIAELEGANVFSRTDNGTIFCRRMVRDNGRRARDRENGKRGGNPNLRSDDKPPLNPPVIAQKPEARSQKPEEDAPRREKLLSQICSELGINLTDDTKRIAWPGDLAAALDAGAHPSELVEAAKIAKSRDKISLKYVISTAAGLRKDRANVHKFDAPKPSVKPRPPRDPTEARKRMEIWVEQCAKYPDKPPNDCWPDEWGPPPGSPGCLITAEIVREFVQ